MSPPTDTVLTSWSRDDVLEFAVRRGTQLRRRRLVLQSSVAAAAVLVLALPLALMANDAESANRLHTVDRPTVTMPDDAGPADATGPSDPAPAGGGAPPSPVATTARGANLPVVRPTTTTTPTTAFALARCDLSEVEMATATDKSSYLAGENVVVTARIRNIGMHPCARPTETDVTIEHEAGSRVFEATEHGTDEAWQPNEEIVVTFIWDQTCPPSAGCTAGLATKGRYTVVASWVWGGETWAQPASFTL